MASESYFNAHVDSANGHLEIGRCVLHDPAHRAFMKIVGDGESSKSSVFCAEKDNLNFGRHVKLAGPLAFLNQGSKTRKMDLTQRLLLYLSKHANGDVDVSEDTGVGVMHVPRTGDETDPENAVGRASTPEDGIVDDSASAGEGGGADEPDAMDIDIASSAMELSKISPTGEEDEMDIDLTASTSTAMVPSIRALTTRSFTNHVQTLSVADGRLIGGAARSGQAFPIYYYDSARDNVVLFNMIHISRTTMINATKLAINTGAVFQAYYSRDSQSFWGALVDAIGQFMPNTVRDVSPNFQRLLVNALGSSAVPVPQQPRLTFSTPLSTNSDSDARLRQALAQNNTCGPVTVRGIQGTGGLGQNDGDGTEGEQQGRGHRKSRSKGSKDLKPF